MVDSTPSLPPMDPSVAKRLDPAFRNGSVTAIGVVLAFSLGFLNNWAAATVEWIPGDLFAVASIAVGIVFQVVAMAGMLAIESLEEAKYRRLIRIFMIGLALVSLGVLIAIGGDALGYGKTLLKR